jgi:zona occludens toxin (predicted ATPase)
MSIKIITGVLGAGKTYFCMYEILNKYFDYDNRFDEWMSKKKIEVITNIHGIKLAVTSLDLEIKKAGGLENYFNVEYHTEEDQKAKVIIIDEAQAPRYFHRKFYNTNVFEFFQWSRHLGIDIYLITQDSSTLAKELQNLAEYEVSAVRRTYQLGMEFRYNLMVDGEIHKRKIVKKDKHIFAAYRSHTVKETEKIPSAVRRNLLLIGSLAVFVVVLGFLFFKVLFGTVVARAEKIKDPVQTVKPITAVQNPIQNTFPMQKLQPVASGQKIDEYLKKNNIGTAKPEDKKEVVVYQQNGESEYNDYQGYMKYKVNGKEVRINVYGKPSKDVETFQSKMYDLTKDTELRR